MKKISNKTKDVLAIIGFFVVFCIMLGLFCWVCSLFAEEITKPSEINKMYAEQTIVYEMQFQKMWEYTEKNMTDKEYADIFLRG